MFIKWRKAQWWRKWRWNTEDEVDPTMKPLWQEQRFWLRSFAFACTEGAKTETFVKQNGLNWNGIYQTKWLPQPMMHSLDIKLSNQ